MARVSECTPVGVYEELWGYWTVLESPSPVLEAPYGMPVNSTRLLLDTVPVLHDGI